jgi:bifunctional non-homologous end joining protein LigD
VADTSDKLGPYRAKRDPTRTREPVPAPGPLPQGRDDTFVIQEHHASALHWDFRLERDGVLVSWAVPKGLPLDPSTNHLAVRTEDHPLEYAAFEGEIPEGEYGGGRVLLWDHGTYECEKWTDTEVKVVLHGSRVSGRYVLFGTGKRGARDWMVHRMDPPPDPDWQPLPTLVRPMMAVAGSLPPASEDDRWGYEMKWDGVRAMAYVEGGRIRLLSRNDRDVTAAYPELRLLGESLGATQALLDGEIVALDPATGIPSFERLQQRMHVVRPAQVRRLARDVPVTFLLFDVVHLAGRDLMPLPYTERRARLDSLELNGAHWQTTPYWVGGGRAVLSASAEQGLEGIVAKRLDSAYFPGRRSDCWVKVKTLRTQEVVIGGWKPGEGRRADTIGSLLLGIPAGEGKLEFVGHVGTGFSERMLADLRAMLVPLEAEMSPFVAVPREHARHARWVRPELVGEVAYADWTREGRLRHPTWRGLRPDKEPSEVVREP